MRPSKRDGQSSKASRSGGRIPENAREKHLRTFLIGYSKADESMRIRLNKFEELLYRLASEDTLIERTSDIRSYVINLERAILTANKDLINSIEKSFTSYLRIQQEHQKKTDKALLTIVQYLVVVMPNSLF